jgi:hypothetical protein
MAQRYKITNKSVHAFFHTSFKTRTSQIARNEYTEIIYGYAHI